MPSRPCKTQTAPDGAASESLTAVHEFLLRELPPQNVGRASYFANASREAGERYVRYKARKDEWSSYAARKHKLESIVSSVEKVATGLSELDVLSRDDLASRIGSKEIDGLVGSLGRLGEQAKSLLEQMQPIGRGRDLALERWILELAEIYESAFHRPATVWRAGGVRSFRRFLEESRPTQGGWAGKLQPRQVDRVLKRRRVARKL